jgi:hypothetical protein
MPSVAVVEHAATKADPKAKPSSDVDVTGTS